MHILLPTTTTTAVNVAVIIRNNSAPITSFAGNLHHKYHRSISHGFIFHTSVHLHSVHLIRRNDDRPIARQQQQHKKAAQNAIYYLFLFAIFLQVCSVIWHCGVQQPQFFCFFFPMCCTWTRFHIIIFICDL